MGQRSRAEGALSSIEVVEIREAHSAVSGRKAVNAIWVDGTSEAFVAIEIESIVALGASCIGCTCRAIRE